VPGLSLLLCPFCIQPGIFWDRGTGRSAYCPCSSRIAKQGFLISSISQVFFPIHYFHVQSVTICHRLNSFISKKRLQVQLSIDCRQFKSILAFDTYFQSLHFSFSFPLHINKNHHKKWGGDCQIVGEGLKPSRLHKNGAVLGIVEPGTLPAAQLSVFGYINSILRRKMESRELRAPPPCNEFLLQLKSDKSIDNM